MSLPPPAFTPLTGSARRLNGAVWATRLQFAAFGFATGTWGVHIPSAKLQHGLDAGSLSLVLLAAAFGAVLCLTVAGKVVTTLGARRVVWLTGCAMCGALALTLQTQGFAALALLLFLFGGAGALFDVAINAEGSVLEALGGRQVMSGLHGMFSAGGMLAAGAGAWWIGAGVAPALQVLAVSALLALLITVGSAFMLPLHPGDPAQQAGYRLPRGLLAVLGVLAAVGLVAEGAMYDWSVLYLRNETAAPPALAALGYASFTGAMAAMRFAGDALRARISAPRLLVASAALAAVSMLTVLLVRDPVVALIGFAGVGIGFANVVPILFIAATQVPGVAPAAAIASVSSIGYLGFMAGPALVGGIAQVSSLSWGLCVVVLGALLLMGGARMLDAPAASARSG